MLFCFVFTFIIIGFASMFASSVSMTVNNGQSITQTTTIAPSSILYLNLNRPIQDHVVESSFDLSTLLEDQETSLALDDIVVAIQAAATHPNIDGIYLRCDNPLAGWAQLWEIRETLESFKAEDKWIHTYAEGYSQKGYYMASIADTLALHPLGKVGVLGLSSKRTFLKNTLDKIGIEMQVVKVGKYKSAVEPFIRESMSKESKEQTTKYLEGLWNVIQSQISSSRSFNKANFNKVINDGLAFRSSDFLLKEHFIDKLWYEDEFLKHLLTLTKHDSEVISNNKIKGFIGLDAFSRLTQSGRSISGTDAKLAILYTSGEIHKTNQGLNEYEGISAQEVVDQLREIREDQDIKAVVLRIDSPGGSALASDMMWREIWLTNKQKPVVVSMGNVVASGGYYMACAASGIVATPLSITGSIGIFGLIPNAHKLLKDKIGLRFDQVNTHELADFPTLSHSLKDKEKQLLQQNVERGYEIFKTHVSEGRNMTLQEVDDIGQGRVWSATDALSIGLVDELGSLDKAIEMVEDKAGIDNYNIVSYPQQKDFWSNLKGSNILKFIKSSILKSSILGNYNNSLTKHFSSYWEFFFADEKSKILTRMPYDIEIE